MKKYALVEWTNEADAGSYSVVKSEWILGYTPEMYLIEWREGQGKKKPPPGGWPMGEAKILQTSDKEGELRKVLNDMTSLKPENALVVTGKRKRIPKKRLYESDDETDTDQFRSSSGDEKRATKRRASSSSPRTPSRAENQPPPAEAPSQSTNGEQEEAIDMSVFQEASSEKEYEESTDEMMTDGPMTEMDNNEEMEEEEESEPEYPPEYELSELEKLRLEVRGLRDEIMLLRHQVCKELPKVHAIALRALGMQASSQENGVKVNQSASNINTNTGNRRRVVRPGRKTSMVKHEAEMLKQQMKQTQVEKKVATPTSPGRSLKQEPVSSPSPGRRQGSSRNKADKVELHPGTGVYIDREAWNILAKLDKPTAFARRLLPFLFSMDTLQNSNLRGGKSTRDAEAEPKKPLDQKKVDAIYKAVTHRFPKVKHCDIGQAINGRLSNLRYHIMKKGKEATKS